MFLNLVKRGIKSNFNHKFNQNCISIQKRCLSGETFITTSLAYDLMPDFKKLRIKSINDIHEFNVRTFNPITERVASTKITNMNCEKFDMCFKLTADENRSIKLNKNDFILTDSGWKSALTLISGNITKVNLLMHRKNQEGIDIIAKSKIQKISPRISEDAYSLSLGNPNCFLICDGFIVRSE